MMADDKDGRERILTEARRGEGVRPRVRARLHRFPRRPPVLLDGRDEEYDIS
jgi:hypothetical protein